MRLGLTEVRAVILINLLPHREAARKRRKEIFNATLGGSAALGGIIAGAILESEIAALRARQQAVEDLQADRNLPVHLLTEIVNQLPDGVYISKLVQVNQLVTINGTAQSNERVSELLRNLANNTPWFAKPQLVEIVAGTVALTPRDLKRVSNFVIRVDLVRASVAEKALAVGSDAPASAPAVLASSQTLPAVAAAKK
jgi:type IV pilus assembly protein PilN